MLLLSRLVSGRRTANLKAGTRTFARESFPGGRFATPQHITGQQFWKFPTPVAGSELDPEARRAEDDMPARYYESPQIARAASTINFNLLR
jgi:hypothetical protein